MTHFARSLAVQPSICSTAAWSPPLKASESACAGVENFAPKRKAWSCARFVNSPPLMPVGNPKKFSMSDDDRLAAWREALQHHGLQSFGGGIDRRREARRSCPDDRQIAQNLAFPLKRQRSEQTR